MDLVDSLQNFSESHLVVENRRINLNLGNLENDFQFILTEIPLS